MTPAGTMVSVNVAQLLQLPAGQTRAFQFAEPLPDVSHDLHLTEPVSGSARLLRTNRGILVSATFQTHAALDCSRCLDAVQVAIDGGFEEEFLPLTDIRTGLPTEEDGLSDPDQPRITEQHEIVLDDLLRQNILTSAPLQPLCAAACPGLCPTCGERLGEAHRAHPQPADRPQEEPPLGTHNPFARLKELLGDRPDGDEPVERDTPSGREQA